MNQNIALIDSPVDYSAFGHGEGCDEGPTAIRDTGLLTGLEKHAIPYKDFGVIPSPKADNPHNPRLKFLNEIKAANQHLYATTYSALVESLFPIVLGGDHSGVIGSIKAAHDFYEDGIGLLWLDAHLDCNTEATTTSGNIHGMVIPQLTGDGAKELVEISNKQVPYENIAVVGIRNPDLPEIEYVHNNAIYMQDIWAVQEQGVAQTINHAIQHLLKSTDKVYVSFDLDVVDEQFAPGVGTPTYGGLTYREIIFVSRVLRRLFQNNQLAGIDIVELNPSQDVANKTANLAVEWIMSVLGFEYGPFVRFRDNRPPLDA